MSKRFFLWIVVFVVVVAVVVVAMYLFRTEKSVAGDHDVSIVFRWGKLARIEMDRFWDGSPDVYMTVEIGNYNNIVVEEMLVDRQNIGVFDARFYPGAGDDFWAELDNDHDGVFETKLVGDDARAIYPGQLGPGY